MSPAPPATVPVTMTVGQGQGSQLTFNPASLALNAAAGGAPVVQAVTVSGTQGGPSTSFTAQATSAGNWLSVTPTTGTTPLPLQITATPALLAAGTYLGTITVTPTGGTASTLNVTFTIGGQGQSLLTANPATLSFSVAANSGPSPAQTLVASSSSALLTGVSAVPSTVGGGTWLAVTPLSGNAPLTLSVSVNPQGLAAGTYTGSIALSTAGSSAPPLNVPVSLTVQNTQTSTLQASPSVLTFNATPSASRTQSQTIALSTSSGTALQVTASIAGGAWISVNPVGVTTPGTLTVSINANGLADGVYQATINLNASNSSPVTVPVTLNVGTGSTTQSEPFPTSLNFEVQSGRPLPGAQLLSIGGSGTFAATATTSGGGSWLQVAPASGSLPGVVLVRLAESVVTALPAGTYTGSVTISPSGTTGGGSTVPVRLNVGNGPALTSNAPILSFTAGVNGTVPNPVTVVVNSTSGTAIPVQAAATVQSGAGWLTVTSSSVTTPASLVLTVNPAGLAAGTYTGTVTVSSSQPGVASLVLPVRLQVQSGNLLNVSSNQLIFSATGTTPPASQTVSVSASSGTGQYSAIAAVVSPAGGSWLALQPTSGSLPGTMTVSANPAGLASGDYAGTITITSASAVGSVVIPVLFTVTGSTSTGLAATPSTLTFTQLPGGTPPGSQTLQLTAPASTSFTASATTVSGGNWLSMNPTSGQAPGPVSVIISNTASLAPGSYTGSVTFVSSAGNATVPVTLTIGTGGTSPLTANPTSLTFSGQAGGVNPVAQSMQIATTAINPAQPFTASATTQSGGSWLTVTPVSGTTPAAIQVSANLTGLTAGTYGGSVLLTPQGGQALTVPVTLTVTGGSGTTPTISGIVNAATQQSGSIAPGLVVFIRGTGLGPVQQALLQLDSQGRVSTTLSNIRVLFDGLPAPLIAVQQDAISTVVPYGVSGRSTVTLVVENNGVPSAPRTLNVADTAPGIFAVTGTGSGQGAILNQDLTINSASNQAARGSIAVLYMTGDGALTPSGVDGAVTTAGLLRKPVKPIELRVGGIAVPASDILYAGAAPSTILGVTQLNFVIPMAVTPSVSVPVEVTVGGVTSSSTVTMAVR